MSTLVKEKSWYSKMFVTVMILLILVSFVVRWRLDSVGSVDSSIERGFSAERAVKVLSGVLGDQRPHPVDSAANNDVRQRIVTLLKDLGYQTDVQDTESCRNVQVYTCARVRNIIAVHAGASPNKLILLSAHYDSVAAGPGASDDGSGVAVLLEVARLLKQQSPGKNGVLLLFTEGEETGLLGAQAFVSQSPLAKQVALAINVEARGTSGQSVLFETGSTSGWLVDQFAASSTRPLADSLVSTVYKLMPNDTDLSVFKAHDVQGLNFAYGEHSAYYHTPDDNLQALDHGSLQQQGDNVYGLVQILLNADLPAGNAMGSAVYTDILGFVVLRWPSAISLGIAIILLTVFAVIAWRLRKSFSYETRSVVCGFFGVLLALVVGGTVAYLLMNVLSLLAGGAAPWHTSIVANRLLLWSTVLVAVVSVQRLIGRDADPLGVWIGVGYSWLLFGIVAAAWFPGSSYLFILPSLAFVVAALLALPTARAATEMSAALFLLPALVAFVVTLQAVFLVEIMLGFNVQLGAIAMGALLGLAATFFAPFVIMNPLSKTLRYSRYAASLLVGISAALSITASAHTKEQPLALNIIYLQNANGDAYIFPANTFSRPPAPVLQAMGPNVLKKQLLPWLKASFYAAPVKSAALSPAKLTVLSERQVPEGRELFVRINADGSAQSVVIYFPKSIGLDSVETEGQTLDYSGKLSVFGDYKVFVCRGESCNNKLIKLILSGKAAQKVLAAKLAAFPDQAASILAARNTDAVPRQDGDQSIVVSESRL